MTIGIDEDPSKYSLRGEIVEIATPYETKDIPEIKKTQSGDVLTLVHLKYNPKELSRYSHYDWVLEDILFKSAIIGIIATFLCIYSIPFVNIKTPCNPYSQNYNTNLHCIPSRVIFPSLHS